MKGLLTQITPALTTALVAISVAFIGCLGKVIVKLVPLVMDTIVAKIGAANYKQNAKKSAMEEENHKKSH